MLIIFHYSLFTIHCTLYIALPGINASTTPITKAPITAPIMDILNPGTMNFVTYSIIAATRNPAIPLPNGEASTPVNLCTK